MISFLHLLALSAYLSGWAALVRAFREGGGDLEDVGWKVAVGGAAVHVLSVAVYLLRYGELPLVGLGPASSTLALAIAVLALAASVRPEARPTILFVLPLVVLLLGEAVWVGVTPAMQQTSFRGPWLAAHVGTSFLGYAGLALASAASAMYVLQFRSLKRKDFGSVFRFFPSLQALDRLNRLGLEIGFTALTLGLLAGWSWTLTYGQGFVLENPQVVFGIITWVAYFTAIVVRIAPGGRGNRAAAASTAAFVVTALAFGAIRVITDASGFFL